MAAAIRSAFGAATASSSSLAHRSACAGGSARSSFLLGSFQTLGGHGLRRGSLPAQGSKGRQLRLNSNGSAVVCAVATEVAAPDISQLSLELQNESPFAIMNKALELYGDDVAIAFSGAEDVALIEYAKLTGRPFRVFSLDTGRLNPETYQLFDKVEQHYGIRIEYTFPDATAVQNLVREKGMFSFYEDGHQECCGIRKVQPLKKALRGLRAWITGQRKDQSPGTRANVPVAQVDPAFEGLDGGKGSLVKFNPLANVSSLEVWDFLRTMEVPTNELHARGFISIGCEPCTKAVLPNQHEREGRWWWEDSTAKECGLHKASSEPGSDSASVDVGYSSSADKNEGIALRDLFEDPAVTKLSRADVEELVLSAEPREESWLLVLYAPWCPYCQAMEASYNEVAVQLVGSGVRVAKFQADKDEKEFAKANLQMKSFPTLLFLPKDSTTFAKRISERRDVFSLLTWVKALK